MLVKLKIIYKKITGQIEDILLNLMTSMRQMLMGAENFGRRSADAFRLCSTRASRGESWQTQSEPYHACRPIRMDAPCSDHD